MRGVVLNGRYVLGPRLGVGGLGAVFEARDRELGRSVAVKFVRRRQSTSDALLRLTREANAMARISNPHVVQVFDVGRYENLESDGVLDDVSSSGLYVVMELVDGTDLYHWLRGPRSMAEILDAFRQAGRGLVAAHDHGVLHRDFKPANVLMARDGTVKVTDFGLAAACTSDSDTIPPSIEDKLASQEAWLIGSLTATGLTMGTPAYMAPEQHRRRDVGPHTDQYAFCLALAEAVYGMRPVEGDTLEELLAAKLRVQLPTSRRVPRSLRRILEKGLRPRPEDRYESMQRLLDALEKREHTRSRSVVLGIAGVAIVLGVAGSSVPPSDDAVPFVEATDDLDRDSDSVDWDAASDGGIAAERQAIDALRDHLRDPSSHEDPARRLELIDELVQRTRAIGDTALIADADVFRGLWEVAHGDHERGAEMVEKAFRKAEVAGVHDVAARSAGVLMSMHEPGEADWERWGRMVELQAELAGGEPAAERGLAMERGFAALNDQRYEDALLEWERAVELAIELHGEYHPATVTSMAMLADVLEALERRPEAERVQRRALALAAVAMPDDVAYLAELHNGLGSILLWGDDLAGAAHELELAMELLGDDPRQDEKMASTRMSTLWALGDLKQKLGQHEEAVELFRRVVPLIGDDLRYNGVPLHRVMAGSLLALDRRDEAIEALRAGVGYVDAEGPEWEARAELRQLLARLERGETPPELLDFD